MIPGSANSLLLAPAAGGYQVSRSLRFNSADSAYLSRTPAVAGNRRTWTWAGWVKRSGLATTQNLFSANGGSTNFSGIRFESTNDLYLFDYVGSFNFNLLTTQVFRDASAWYHILVAFDTTQSTASNRVKLYVNGVQITNFATANYPSQNYDGFVNTTNGHSLGCSNSAGFTEGLNGYMADIHFIDGQALTPSSFTEVSATTGQLIPKAYSGSFGTNGFWLKFSDNSAATAAALGNDYSGNNNDWTPNNLSVTAGAGNDSLVDTPTSYGTDTGVGNEVRGNYCTINLLDQRFTDNGTISNGNLDYVQSSTGARTARGSIGVSSGKWYWEFTYLGGNVSHGISKASSSLATYPGGDADGWSWFSGGGIYNNGGTTGAYSSSTYTTNDVIGVALDLAAGTLVYYKNGVSQGTAASGLSGTWFPAFGSSNTVVISFNTNFGQRAFAYPLSGFKALCDTNLPAPVVAKPNTLMDVALWTGTGATLSITGLGFSPDFVWIKGRSSGPPTIQHVLQDTVRGSNNMLCSNATGDEASFGQPPVWGYISAFNSDGFTLASGSSGFSQVNQSSNTYVGWAWDAGTSTVSNTAGSITSQVRANASAGFSVVGFNSGSAGNYTVGHGLGVKPQFIITKARNGSTFNWSINHVSIATTVNKYLTFTTSATSDNGSAAWGASLADTNSTTFGISSANAVEASKDCIAYCFAPVVGYSSFSSYTGTSGQNFVHLGFRPKLLMIKNSSNGSFPAYTGWAMFDSSRSTYNVNTNALWANSSQQEGLRGNGGAVTTADFAIDLLSNGFCLRDNGASEINLSGNTYIFAAWAENPFAYARAR